MGLSTTYTKVETDFLIQQLEKKSEALYTDDTLAGDIIKRVDINTGENVNYREVTTWHDGSAMDDSKVDGFAYRKISTKYYKITLNGAVNIKQLGAKGDGVTDDSAIFQLAVTLFENIHIPKGVYRCNFNIGRKIRMTGDGSLYTKLKPANESVAIITYKNSAPYWTYNTHFEGIGFWNQNTDESPRKSGVAFTFGYTDLTSPIANSEFYTNVTFQNCYFYGFERAFQTPCGNIACDFINCGAAANKYAFYFTDAKFGSEIMHAGCKTFYGGEFSGNDCVCYYDNTEEGFGQIIFRNVIFEHNKINVYANNTTGTFTPVLFDGCWDEANGQAQFHSATFNVDVWTGTTLSTTSVLARGFIFKGVGEYIFMNGRVAELYCDGDLSVIVDKCTIEEKADYIGAKWNALNGALITLKNCKSYGGSPRSNNIISINPVLTKNKINITSNVDAKSFVIENRFHKTTVKNSYTKTYETAENLNGWIAVEGTVVEDGRIFDNCTEWTIPFTSVSEQIFAGLNSLTINSGKYFFISVDIKADDLPNIVIMNGSGSTLGMITENSTRGLENKWFTLGIAGYANADITDLSIWFLSKSTTVKVRLSAFQAVQFDTLSELNGYFDSKIYAI